MYLEPTDRIAPMPMCTQSRNRIWDAEQGFPHVETGLQLQAGAGSFLSSPSHSIETLPDIT